MKCVLFWEFNPGSFHPMSMFSDLKCPWNAFSGIQLLKVFSGRACPRLPLPHLCVHPTHCRLLFRTLLLLKNLKKTLKLNTENIWRQDDPPSRIFVALGSSSLHVNSPLNSLLTTLTLRVSVIKEVHCIEPSSLLWHTSLTIEVHFGRVDWMPFFSFSFLFFLGGEGGGVIVCIRLTQQRESTPITALILKMEESWKWMFMIHIQSRVKKNW